nr:MAG: S-layer family protein [Leptolyngbya sp. IPPAS B-1204]
MSTIAVEGTRGNAGRIQIRTNKLSVRDGATLQSSTLGEGNAGNLSIRATESIELIGVGAGTEVPSGLFSLSGGIPGTNFEINRSATGRAGNLRVTTHLLTVQDNAVIAVGSANPNLDERGLAGNLRITANRLQADNQARLLANTNSGRGGNIDLQVSDLLLLNRNSEISTTAGSERRGGDGGNIILDTGFLIGSPNTNNDITANAFTGDGGDIQINGEAILGLSPADTLTPRNDPQSNITASSALGVDGDIIINSPDTDPTRGLQLPELPLAEPLLVRDCLPTSNLAHQRSSFVVVGRGGLPPTPNEILNSEELWQDWRLTEVETAIETEAVGRHSIAAVPTQTLEITEAQGWLRSTTGQVKLIAHATTPTIPPIPFPSGCFGSRFPLHAN